MLIRFKVKKRVFAVLCSIVFCMVVGGRAIQGMKPQKDKQLGHQEDSSTTPLLNLLNEFINMDTEEIAEQVVAFMKGLTKVVPYFEQELKKDKES